LLPSAGEKSTIDFDQSDDWSRVLSFFYDQNRFNGDPDCGDVGVWAPLACADDWTCDSQSVVDFAKRRDRILIQLVYPTEPLVRFLDRNVLCGSKGEILAPST
jgi:hypothetical protein